MTSGKGSTGGIAGIRRWWRRRQAQRARLAHAVWDLRERYGAAAYAIARSSAQQAIGRDGRRFWATVAQRIAREPAGAGY